MYSMICYTKEMSEGERDRLHAYWEFSEGDFPNFKHTAKEIDERRTRNEGVIAKFLKKPNFVVNLSQFECKRCKQKLPVRTRSEAIKRINSSELRTCSSCEKEINESLRESAIDEIALFKLSKFSTGPTLEDLSYEQLFSLLILVSEQETGNYFLSDSPSSLTITGSEFIDQVILKSLIDIRALVYIEQIPLRIEAAYEQVYGDSYYFNYMDTRLGKRYHGGDFIVEGVYTNTPLFDGFGSVQNSVSFR